MDPPEPAAPEGFLLSEARLIEKYPGAEPERETRIPGLAPNRRAPKSAGPAGGNEAQAGYRWQSEPLQGFARSGAPFTALRQNFSKFGLPRLAAEPTLVVKISDTSRHGNSGFESRL